nr:immunoglobulin heavy chain junction region [Mus musculus]
CTRGRSSNYFTYWYFDVW